MTEQILKLPDYSPVDFKRNLITTAVCELRFPVILELESKPPIKLHSTIRKDYPHYERRTNINFQPGSEVKEIFYVFLSRNKEWKLTIKPYSISLETEKYVSFTDFMNRLKNILTAASKYIDTNFYTRVGLRYIDNIPVNNDPYEEWINPDLVRPLTVGTYGAPDLYWQTIRSTCQYGKFTFQHGIRNSKKEFYILDFDFFEENVELKDTYVLIKNLHSESLKLFFWSIHEKSIYYMNNTGD